MWPKRQAGLVDDPLKVDTQLYDGFVSDDDRTKMSAVRVAQPEELSIENFTFKDGRLKLLLPLYKARNFAKQLDGDELRSWNDFRYKKLVDSGQADKFFKRLQEIAATSGISGEQKYLLEELNLYGQSVISES